MRTEKYLKKKAEEDLLNQKSERMEEFKSEFALRRVRVKPIRNKRRIAVFSSVAAACCAVAVCVTVGLNYSGGTVNNDFSDLSGGASVDTQGNTTADGELSEIVDPTNPNASGDSYSPNTPGDSYSPNTPGDSDNLASENLYSLEASIDEVNACLKQFAINLGGADVCCTLTKNLASGESVYYSVALEKDGDYGSYVIELIYVVNENYKYAGLDGYSLEEKAVDEYTVKYSKINEEADGEYTVYGYVGAVTRDGETLYIAEYKQRSSSDGFLSVINSVISAK